MQLANVVKSELYKNFCRKSTYILLIPVLLSFLITLGFRTGTVSLSMIGNSSKTLSCMDYLFMNWMVLSSSGIIGLLFLQLGMVPITVIIALECLVLFLMHMPPYDMLHMLQSTAELMVLSVLVYSLNVWIAIHCRNRSDALVMSIAYLLVPLIVVLGLYTIISSSIYDVSVGYSSSMQMSLLTDNELVRWLVNLICAPISFPSSLSFALFVPLMFSPSLLCCPVRCYKAEQNGKAPKGLKYRRSHIRRNGSRSLRKARRKNTRNKTLNCWEGERFCKRQVRPFQVPPLRRR